MVADDLKPMNCRSCGRLLSPRKGEPVRASSWETCLFQCPCGDAYSNAKNPDLRRRLVQRPELNVPIEVRDGVSDALGDAANERNRPSKLQKFCSELSEDAVTWATFRWLEQSKALTGVARLLGEAVTGEPCLSFWGSGFSSGRALAARLQQVSAALGEKPQSRSEPDVILEWPELLIVFEAKLGSENDRKSDSYAGWHAYLAHSRLFRSTVGAKQTGLYQLVRNWVIGSELAGAKRFVLVNLGPTGAVEADVARLEGTLAIKRDRRFVAATWGSLVHADTPDWLTRFLRSRGAC